MFLVNTVVFLNWFLDNGVTGCFSSVPKDFLFASIVQNLLVSISLYVFSFFSGVSQKKFASTCLYSRRLIYLNSSTIVVSFIGCFTIVSLWKDITVCTYRWVFFDTKVESFLINYDFGFASWCSVSTFLKCLRISVDFFNALKCLAFSNNCFSWIDFDFTADKDEKFFITVWTNIDELSSPILDISPILLALVLSKTADFPSVNSP